MPRIHGGIPFVAVMHPKKIHAFCGPECCVVPFSKSVLRNLSRDQVFLTGYKWRQTYPGTQLRESLSNSEVHIEDIGWTVHIYFLSANKMSRPAKALVYVKLLSPVVQRSTYSILCDK
jgi:hypothetical protein